MQNGISSRGAKKEPYKSTVTAHRRENPVVHQKAKEKSRLALLFSFADLVLG
jgi:hypothetical protein